MRSIGLFLLLLFPIYGQSQESTTPEKPFFTHPKSIMKMTQEENSRLYTFPGDLFVDGYTLKLDKINTCDPYPLIVGDSLIVLESIERYLTFDAVYFLFDRYDHILSSISLNSGRLNYAREIFQPILHFDAIDPIWCKIRGVYEWQDKIVVVLLYDDYEEDHEFCDKAHIYIISNQDWNIGHVIGSYGYDAYGVFSLGVDVKHDRLLFIEAQTYDHCAPNWKEKPILWQIDLNTGDVVDKQETDLKAWFLNPSGTILETRAPYNTDEKFTNIYSVVPFKKIATYPIYLGLADLRRGVHKSGI